MQLVVLINSATQKQNLSSAQDEVNICCLFVDMGCDLFIFSTKQNARTRQVLCLLQNVCLCLIFFLCSTKDCLLRKFDCAQFVCTIQRVSENWRRVQACTI